MPWWDKELTDMKEKRDSLFREMRDEFRVAERIDLENEYKTYRNKVCNMIKSKKKAFKIKNLEKINNTTSDSELWKMVQACETGVSGKSLGVAPLINKEDQKITNNSLEKANILGKHYFHVSSSNNFSEKFKNVRLKHRERNKHLLEKKDYQ